MTEAERKKFLEAIIRVYARYGLSIGHEDGHGAFLIERDSAEAREWLRAAEDGATLRRAA